MDTQCRSVGRWGRATSRLALAVLLCALGLLLVPHDQPAHAATTFTVQDYADGVADKTRCPGPTCRLRDALAAGTSGDQITFGSAGHTIKLTQGELTLNKDLTIFFDGTVGDITIDAQSASRVFNVTAGTTATLDTLRLVHGKPAAGTSGGAIQIASGATLKLKNVDIANSEVQGAFGLGGAIFNGGTLSITDSTISANRSAGVGGGLANSGSLTIQRSLIYSNTVTGSSAGGIYNGGILTMTNTTLSTNATTDYGGGLANDVSSFADLNNVTITKNTADSDANGTGDGGGIFNCSVSTCAAKGTVNIRNSIIAGNFDSSPSPNPKHPDCSGPLTSQGYNLLKIDTGCSGLTNGVNGDLVGTSGSPLNAMLAELADNGGPTLTHALQPGSPAIDAGNPVTPGTGGAACARLDQRGYPRGGAAGRCDMGAYERVFLHFLPLVVR